MKGKLTKQKPTAFTINLYLSGQGVHALVVANVLVTINQLTIN